LGNSSHTQKIVCKTFLFGLSNASLGVPQSVALTRATNLKPHPDVQIRRVEYSTETRYTPPICGQDSWLDTLILKVMLSDPLRNSGASPILLVQSRYFTHIRQDSSCPVSVRRYQRPLLKPHDKRFPVGIVLHVESLDGD